MRLTDKQIAKLKEIALAAGKIHLQYFGRDPEVEYKSDCSPVTTADKESNDYIIQQIRKEFPGFGIVSEESLQEWQDATFTVDPLAGTVNFMRENPNFDVMIGLMVDGKPEFGLIYNPVEQEFWYGGKNYGSHYASADRTVAVKIETHKADPQNIILTKSSTSWESLQVELAKRNIKPGKVVYAEDSLYKRPFCFLALQEANLYITFKYKHFKHYIWDWLPSHAFLEGAGGMVLRFDGSELQYTWGDQCFDSDFVGTDSKERVEKLFKSR